MKCLFDECNCECMGANCMISGCYFIMLSAHASPLSSRTPTCLRFRLACSPTNLYAFTSFSTISQLHLLQLNLDARAADDLRCAFITDDVEEVISLTAHIGDSWCPPPNKQFVTPVDRKLAKVVHSVRTDVAMR